MPTKRTLARRSFTTVFSSMVTLGHTIALPSSQTLSPLTIGSAASDMSRPAGLQRMGRREPRDVGHDLDYVTFESKRGALSRKPCHQLSAGVSFLPSGTTSSNSSTSSPVTTMTLRP